MDEAQIAQQLTSKIPVDTPTEPAPVYPDDEPLVHSNLELNTNEGLLFSDYFNVDRIGRHTDSVQQQLREVHRWAAERAGTNDTNKVLETLRYLEVELGISMKPNRLQRLARWVELERKTQAFRAQQEMIRHG